MKIGECSRYGENLLRESKEMQRFLDENLMGWLCVWVGLYVLVYVVVRGLVCVGVYVCRCVSVCECGGVVHTPTMRVYAGAGEASRV